MNNKIVMLIALVVDFIVMLIFSMAAVYLYLVLWNVLGYQGLPPRYNQVGFGLGMLVYLWQPCWVVLKQKKHGATIGGQIWYVIKNKLKLLGLVALWVLGLLGLPILGWLVPTILLVFAAGKLLQVYSPTWIGRLRDGNNTIGFGFKPSERIRAALQGFLQRANELRLGLNALSVSAVIIATLLAGAAAEIVWRTSGLISLAAIVFVTLAVVGLSKSRKRLEQKINNELEASIKTRRYSDMKKLQEALSERYPAAFLAQQHRLRVAIEKRLTGYAVALRVAAKSPSMRYYANIFKAAAHNLVMENFAINVTIENIDPNDEQLVAMLNANVNQPDDNYLVTDTLLLLRTQSHNETAFLVTRSTSDLQAYHKGMKMIIAIINSLIDEKLFFDKLGGLQLNVKLVQLMSAKFTFLTLGTRRSAIPSTLLKINLQHDLASADYNYVISSYGLASFHQKDMPLDKYLKRQIGYDLTNFYSETLGIPFDSMLKKTIPDLFSRSFADKVAGFLKDELEGQLQDMAIEAIAEKFFGENAELVADLLGEALKDRASNEIADLVKDFLVDSVLDVFAESVGALTE